MIKEYIIIINYCYALHSYVETIFSNNNSLYYSMYLPETERNSLKTACGCPCGGVTKSVTHVILTPYGMHLSKYNYTERVGVHPGNAKPVSNADTLCGQAHGDRDRIANILIVVTDGRSNNKPNTLQEAAELHKTNMNVFAVGVGSNLDRTELEAIASKPQNVFTVSNFDALDSLQATLKKTACEGQDFTVVASVNVVFLLGRIRQGRL